MDAIHHRRYYGDSYTWAYDAEVIEASTETGEPYVILDSTYFYPTSGGQPHDTGTLGAATVTDVRIRESDGAVIHVLDTSIERGTV